MKLEHGEQALTDEAWQAVITNNAAYDGIFFYAVQTTGIFCRPSCKSKPPKKENIRIFHSPQNAADAGFRSCKRCKSAGERLPDTEWVALMTQYMDNHYMEHLTLELLADMCHGSPYHLHRTFKKVMHMTPVDYIQHKRIAVASEYLQHTKLPIAEIAAKAGIANIPYFTTLFKKKTGYTPAQFRNNRNNQRAQTPDKAK
jgi:AraC family transcriptional regulator, regulatory protein of adaptative response / methylphosphotriester-DNA alkyltransferase methyltransferase